MSIFNAVELEALRWAMSEAKASIGGYDPSERDYFRDQLKIAESVLERLQAPGTGFIYMASPYSGSPRLMSKRYHQAKAAVTELLSRGLAVYSPIVHNHVIATNSNLPRTFDFWSSFDFAMLRISMAVAVLQLPGWEKSHGVTAEVTDAKLHGVEVIYWKPEEVGVEV